MVRGSPYDELKFAYAFFFLSFNVNYPPSPSLSLYLPFATESQTHPSKEYKRGRKACLP